MPNLLAAATESMSFVEGTQAFFSFVANHWNFCLLHFLEFAIWGSWFVVLANVLNARGFSRTEIGRIYGCLPIGSMITPLIIGALADSVLDIEVIIGVSHLVGGVLLFAMAKAKNARAFYWLTLVYSLAFSPTLNLVNSIVFGNAEIFGGSDAVQAGFPWIRVFGTLGWILAGMSLGLFMKKGKPMDEKPLLIAAVLSFVLGLYAFTLPTPPPPEVAEVADAGEAAGFAFSSIFELLAAAPVFFAVTFVAAVAMGLYFAFAALFVEQKGVPANVVGPVMTLGQWIEIFFMLTLPWFLGPKQEYMNWVLFVGIAAWALRFGLFAIGNPLPMVLFGIAIHGICFDFFFAAGMINTEKIAPEGLTSTAQSLYGFLVYGLGLYVGSEASGWLNQRFSKTSEDESGKTITETRWRPFWAIPCAIVSVAVLAFALTATFDVVEAGGPEEGEAVSGPAETEGTSPETSVSESDTAGEQAAESDDAADSEGQ